MPLVENGVVAFRQSTYNTPNGMIGHPNQRPVSEFSPLPSSFPNTDNHFFKTPEARILIKSVSKSTPRSTRQIQNTDRNVRNGRRRASSSSSSGVLNDISFASAVSTHQSSRDLRREIRLLRLRLEELRLQLGPPTSNRDDEKENRVIPPLSADSLRTHHLELQTVCDSLLALCRSQDTKESKEQTAISRMYKNHIHELSAECSQVRNENSALRQKLTLIDSRISEVLSENSFLRWESEQNTNTLEETRRRLDEKSLTVRELQAEVRCLKSNQSEISRIQATKLQDQISNVRAEEKRNNERVVRELETKLKEEHRARLQVQDECTYLKSQEINPKTLDRLAEDNRELYRKLIESRRKFNDHLSGFYERESQLMAQLQKLKGPTSTEPSSGSTANPSEVEAAKNVRFGLVERISTDGQIFRQTIAEWEEKFSALRKENELEREQRKNVTKILSEMAKEMKILNAKVKE